MKTMEDTDGIVYQISELIRVLMLDPELPKDVKMENAFALAGYIIHLASDSVPEGKQLIKMITEEFEKLKGAETAFGTN